MSAKAGRTYSSPLRLEQAAATRDRIIDATVALLQDNDVGAFGMQDVADQAGVAVRTVYRAFPTKDDLITGVLEAVKARFESSAGTPPATAAELEASVGASVRAVFELEPLYRALFATAAGRELHARTSGQRRAVVADAFAEELAGLSDGQAEQFAAVVHLVTSSRGVLFLKEYVGLDAEAATAALSWALGALVAAVRDPQMRARLGQFEEGAG